MQKFLLVLFVSLLMVSSVSAQFNPKAISWYRTGLALKDQNKLLEAQVAYKRAIAYDKRLDSAYVETGYVNTRFGKYDSALYHYRKAIAYNPENIQAHLGMGFIFRDAKPNYDSAIGCFRRILAIDSAHLRNADSLHKVCYYSIAWCYNSMKKYDPAIENAIKALDIDNTYRPGYSELAHAIHLSQQYERGIVEFNKRLAISEFELSHLYLGLIYTELKNKEMAMDQYEKLKKINEKMAESLKRNIDKMK